MQSVTGIAIIRKTDGSPAAGLAVRLQTFALATGRWNNVAAGEVGGDGRVVLTGALAVSDEGPAPQLRLVKASGTAILSEGGRIAYDKATGQLSIEFGDIADLGEESVQPAPLEPQFVRMRHVIGGAPFVALRAGAAPAAAAATVSAQPQIALLNRQLFEHRDMITGLQRALDDERKETVRLNANIARIPELERAAAEKVGVENDLKAERLRIGELEGRINLLTSENQRLAAPRPKTIAMSTMTSNIGAEIKAAQEQLRSTPGSLALSSVRINLKGIPGEGATKVTLPDEKDLQRPEVVAGLANVDLEFSTDVEAPPADTQVTVPDVRRLTEGAARQVLHSLGLRLAPVAGPAASGGVAAGQASMQAPAAGERAPRGATITVVFAS